jgi:hypothetical protein
LEYRFPLFFRNENLKVPSGTFMLVFLAENREGRKANINTFSSAETVLKMEQ